MSAAPEIKAFFDEATHTVSYLVFDPASREGAVIDPVLDFDQRSGEASVKSADAMIAAAANLDVKIAWVLETHAHADHLSAAPYIKLKTKAKVGIGEHIRQVQRLFRPVFNAMDVSGDGAEFDHLFRDGERFRIGGLEAEVIYTPGHTPACISYRIEDAVFVGDTLFMPDVGTARTDFPGGDARTLFRSVRTLLALPDATRVFVCHDYPPSGRGPQWQTTVAEQRTRNIHVHDGVGEDDFVRMREARDRTLAAPALLLPALQVNIRAGALPPPEPNGIAYLRIPVDAFPGSRA